MEFILETLQQSDFVAIDFEMSGMASEKKIINSGLDSVLII